MSVYVFLSRCKSDVSKYICICFVMLLLSFFCQYKYHSKLCPSVKPYAKAWPEYTLNADYLTDICTLTGGVCDRQPSVYPAYDSPHQGVLTSGGGGWDTILHHTRHEKTWRVTGKIFMHTLEWVYEHAVSVKWMSWTFLLRERNINVIVTYIIYLIGLSCFHCMHI